MHFCPSRTLKLKAKGVKPDSLSKFIDCYNTEVLDDQGAWIPESNCPECEITLDTIDRVFPDWTETNVDSKYIGYNSRRGKVVLEEDTDEQSPSTLYKDIIIKYDWQRDGCEKKVKCGRSRNQNAALKWAKTCIEECDQKHGETCSRSPDILLPRRLLDIHGNKIVLLEVDQKDFAKYGKYAALSYCWGTNGKDVRKTTSETYRAHRQAIGIKRLPQTIADTIKVCRALDIRYLWVDGLCILQAIRPEEGEELTEEQEKGNKEAYEDWKRESSRMHDVYGNAYLTIIAESANDSTLGYLESSKFGCTSDRYYNQHRPRPSLLETLDTGETTLVKDGSEPRERGWCFKEYLISNRRLRFFEAELVWECNDKSSCQCGHWTYSDQDDYALREVRVALSKSTPMDFDHIEKWKEIVEAYSWRVVSKPEANRLVAIAGIPDMFQRALGPEHRDEYRDGLWKSDGIGGFCWITHAEKRDHIRLTGKAPSWSWGSVRGPVSYPDQPRLIRGGKPIQQFHAKVKTFEDKENKNLVELEGLLMPIEVASLSKELSDKWLLKRDRGAGETERPIALARTKDLKTLSFLPDSDEPIDGAVMLNSLADDGSYNTCWNPGNCGCGIENQSCFSDTKGFVALGLYTWEVKFTLPKTTNAVRSRASVYTGADGKRRYKMRSGSSPYSAEIRWSEGQSPRAPPTRYEMWYLVLKRLPTGYYRRIGIGFYERDTPAHAADIWAIAEDKVITVV